MGVSQYVLVLFNRNKFAQLITAVTLKVCRNNQAGLIPDQTGFILLLLTGNGNNIITIWSFACHVWLCTRNENIEEVWQGGNFTSFTLRSAETHKLDLPGGRQKEPCHLGKNRSSIKSNGTWHLASPPATLPRLLGLFYIYILINAPLDLISLICAAHTCG